MYRIRVAVAEDAEEDMLAGGLPIAQPQRFAQGLFEGLPGPGGEGEAPVGVALHLEALASLPPDLV